MSAARVAAIREAIPGRVAKGSTLLSRLNPWWFHQVDPDRLDLDSCSHCVLGQLFGEYDRGIQALFRDVEDRDQYADHGPHVEHGFFVENWDTDYEERQSLTEYLAMVWILRIRRLREAANER
jgi:hypothetical protein